MYEYFKFKVSRVTGTIMLVAQKTILYKPMNDRL